MNIKVGAALGSLALIASLAACGSGARSDDDQVRSLTSRAIGTFESGNVAALAGLMNPECSGDFLGNAAMAKAFGIDMGEFMKSMAAAAENAQKQNTKLIINGDTATWDDGGNKDGSPDFVKVNGTWYLDCSDQKDSGTDS
jgi:hypothetical protein